ncbi:MAG: biosynthetic peptidoglycan transglycosylase [Bacteroidia bacterium]
MSEYEHYISEAIVILREKMSQYKPLTWVVGGALYLICMGLLLHSMVVMGMIGTLPEDEDISRITNPLAAEVYSIDGVLLGRYYLEERTIIDFDSISQNVIDALIATEDARFYEHDGIDLRSLIRVFVKSILLGDESAGGGSTITQQLAKNLFPRQSFPVLSLPINKIRETEIAQRMESYYSKQEILSLSQYGLFGENTFGIETASQRFLVNPLLSFCLKKQLFW